MLKLGRIASLNETQNIIKVQDIYDNSVVDIPLDNTVQWQLMPMVGDIVLYINLQDRIIKIIKVWNVQPNALIRGGDFPLREGESQLMGILGQYIFLDREGTIKFVDATLLNFMQLDQNGLGVQVKGLNFTTYDGVNVVIGEDIVISRDKENNLTISQQQLMEANGETPSDNQKEFLLTIDKNGVEMTRKDVKVTIDVNNNITVKGAEIVIDGSSNVSVTGTKVCLGALASDQTLGDVVTGGPLGTFPVCLVTGAPIIGSVTVKAKG
jgi:hypothetical protein